ncbi:hypothetical protein KJ693_01310 [bacterium]|nr:hypothetical protein [bacterium]MBU1613928.1 hypothetical protein [bacterium]
MAKFVNPYNFVALGVAQRNAPIAFHHKFTGNSGVIECSLQALTRIFIPSRLGGDVGGKFLGKDNRGNPRYHYTYREFHHCEEDETPIIPGSSLKGMLRSVIEAMTDGCLSTFKGFYQKNRQPYDYSNNIDDFLPPGIKSDNCSVPNSCLCYACNLFGTMSHLNSIVICRRGGFKTLDANLEEDEEGKQRAKYQRELGVFLASAQTELNMHPTDYGVKAERNLDTLGIKSGDILLKINGQQVTASTYKDLLQNLAFVQAGQNMKSVLRGKVEITDARYESPKSIKYDSKLRRLKPLSTPNPNHVPFYSSDQTNLMIRGRKFYYHHPDYDDVEFENACCDNRNDRYQHLRQTVNPLLSGSCFSFKVYFNNLTDAELGLLLWALEIDDKNIGEAELLAHKIGMGKPLGLGSVKIKVARLELIDPKSRYTDFEASNESNVFSAEKGNLAAKLQGLKKACPDPLAQHLDLKHILTFEHKQGKPIHYPDKTTWFDRDKQLKTELPPELKPDDTSNPEGGELDKYPQATKQSIGKIGEQQPKPPKPVETVKIGQKVKGTIISVIDLKGTARLESGGEVDFTKRTKYQPALPNKKATFIIKSILSEGKISQLELEKIH